MSLPSWKSDPYPPVLHARHRACAGGHARLHHTWSHGRRPSGPAGRARAVMRVHSGAPRASILFLPAPPAGERRRRGRVSPARGARRAARARGARRAAQAPPRHATVATPQTTGRRAAVAATAAFAAATTSSAVARGSRQRGSSRGAAAAVSKSAASGDTPAVKPSMPSAATARSSAASAVSDVFSSASRSPRKLATSSSWLVMGMCRWSTWSVVARSPVSLARSARTSQSP